VTVELPESKRAFVDGSIEQSNFTNNIGSCIVLSDGGIGFSGIVLFMNNTADNGAALHLSKGSAIGFDQKTHLQFVNNSATSCGGAIFVDLTYTCGLIKPIFFFYYDEINATVLFINNIAQFYLL